MTGHAALRFSTRIRRRTLKAEELARDISAKSNPAKAKRSRGRKDEGTGTNRAGVCDGPRTGELEAVLGARWESCDRCIGCAEVAVEDAVQEEAVELIREDVVDLVQEDTVELIQENTIDLTQEGVVDPMLLDNGVSVYEMQNSLTIPQPATQGQQSPYEEPCYLTRDPPTPSIELGQSWKLSEELYEDPDGFFWLQ